MSSGDRKMFEQHFKENLISTDLYVYMLNPIYIQQLTRTEESQQAADAIALDWNNAEHRRFIRATIMVSSVWSMFVKPFRLMERVGGLIQDEHKRIAQKVYAAGKTPLSWFTSDKEIVPEFVLKLLNHIATPAFCNLKYALPETARAYDNCM